MDQKTYQHHKHQIGQTWTAGEKEEAFELAHGLISELWGQKDYARIVEVFDWNLLNPKDSVYSFEVAYSLAEQKRSSDSERVYESLLRDDPRNSSILNNLHILKRARDQLEEAWKLIKRAKVIAPRDEIIDRNFNAMKALIEERKAVEDRFRAAASRVSRENDFVLSKLRAFLVNAQKDPSCHKLVIPIPKWKLRVLMGTDAQKASLLVDQWVEKDYLRVMDERGQYGEYVYQINPFLEQALNGVEKSRVPRQWAEGLQSLDADHLLQLGYFEMMDRVKKVKRTFRAILERDLNELFLNYLMTNSKAVVILSGSLVETLLIYHCEKKKISRVIYERNEREISKRLYDADLGDLLNFFEQQGMLSDLFVHMGNIARISRNFVHPGKELRESEQLSRSKADMCFISALEVARHIC